MNRDEAIKLLKSGPDGIRKWNQWRKQEEDIPDLSDAILNGADLSDAILSGADLGRAICWHTSLGNVNLSEIKGLESIRHDGRSTVGINTLFSSNGKLPEAFLRGCGVSEILIVNQRALVGLLEPIQFYSCFISL
jgi:hypothetical protein